MEFDVFLQKVLNFYEVKTITDLAVKLNLNRATVSGWKNRKTYAPILEYLFLNDLEALKCVLDNNKVAITKALGNTVQNISINDILLQKTKEEAEKYGLNTNSYIEHLIIQDLEKKIQ